ncbi:MAG: hypothetical protein J0L59_01430 [Xanthomonadales bacterium]|nr:hypothetical protein [Xanthomonadales bacterium]
MSHITVKAVRTFVRDLHAVTLDELAFHLFDNQADAISSVSRRRIHHTLIADGWRVRRVRDGEGKPARTYHYDRPKHAIPATINVIPASGDPDAIPAGRRYTLIEQVPTAITILQDARQAILDRAATRDLDAERSMARAVTAFNAITGLQLTETQGWLFMVQLKAARATAGALNVDDYVDGAGYFGLAGECAAREQAGAA